MPQFSKTSRTLLAALAVLMLGADDPKQTPKPEQKGARVDRYGDALPDGAIARLGTTRFVHVGLKSVAVSADGKVAASGGSGETILLWDTTTGRPIRKIAAPGGPITALLFAPDGTALYAGCGSLVAAWNLANGKRSWEREAFPKEKTCRTVGPIRSWSWTISSFRSTMPRVPAWCPQI